VRQWQDLLIGPILRHENPAAAACLDRMNGIAAVDLKRLGQQDLTVTLKQPSQIGPGIADLVQALGRNA
jgi:uncharacterized phosphosugar-binding protein